MGAPTEVYVDPAIAANTGSGTIGDPYGDLQHALNTKTRDSTNGDRFNIKAGTAEILAGILSLATYGTPTADAPLIFEGYTAAAGDGGQGNLDGNNGNFSILPVNQQFVVVRNLKIHNSGTAKLIDWSAADWNIAEWCEFATCTNAVAFDAGGGRVRFCNFSGGFGTSTMPLSGGAGAKFIGNYFLLSSNVTNALGAGGADNWLIEGNIIAMTNAGATGNAIRINSQRGGVIRHNSILCNAGTGRGIFLNSTGADGPIIENNIISGFSGSGGDGIEVTAGSYIGEYGYNAFYNNTADETGVGTTTKIALGGNELAMASDPFAKSGANTFANRFTYFEPNDVGSIRGGANPVGCRYDIGAVQHADPAGGGGGPGGILVLGNNR